MGVGILPHVKEHGLHFSETAYHFIGMSQSAMLDTMTPLHTYLLVSPAWNSTP